MPVEDEAAAARVRRVNLDPEDALALRVEEAVGHEVGDAAARLKARVEREPRRGPLGAPLVLLSDESTHPPVPHIHETCRECSVVVNEPLVDLEDVHAPSPVPRADAGTGPAVSDISITQRAETASVAGTAPRGAKGLRNHII